MGKVLGELRRQGLRMRLLKHVNLIDLYLAHFRDLLLDRMLGEKLRTGALD